MLQLARCDEGLHGHAMHRMVHLACQAPAAVARGKSDGDRARSQIQGMGHMLRRPKIRWCSWMPRHLLWWGGVALTLGGVVFCLATTGRLAGQFNAVHYTTVQKVTSPPHG